jgi:signal transduction histidine kinase
MPEATRFRPRSTILVKLILAYVVPTILLFAVFAVVAHEVARGDLEEELGVRLAAVAGAAATHVRDPSLARLGPGHETDARYLQCRDRLRTVAAAAAVARIYVFDRELRSRCDTEELPIGSPYYQLKADRTELARVFERGEPAASLLFEGKDGKQYKAGYAPVAPREPSAAIELAVGVDAPAVTFARLADLRKTLILYGVGFAGVVLLGSVVMALLVTRPVRDLAAAAERIGRGDLAVPIEPASRDELGLLAVTMDEMRRGLAARDERMQLMLSGIAHEVRNPLGGIELFAGILREELAPDDPRRPHVERIEKELADLDAVVGDFLEYARRPAPVTERVDLGELAADVVGLVKADADAVRVALSVAAADVVCRADPRQLRRALLNLLRNAVQAAAGSADAAAGVRAEARADATILEVWNTGPAIAEDLRERMFEPFFTTREKGTGLGLAFVREIVSDHGGTIQVHRSADARTVFELVLPGPPKPQEGDPGSDNPREATTGPPEVPKRSEAES